MATSVTTLQATDSAAEVLTQPADIAPLEFFSIPQAREVHGNAFPLGILVNQGEQFPDVDAAARHIEGLADKGVFNQLLANRKNYIPA